MKEQEHQVYIGNYPLREAPLLKYLIGKYFYIYAWVLPFIVLYAVPWGFLYDQEWYRSYMDFVRPVLPVLGKIHDSKVAFPEYAVAFLAFFNIFGFLLCILGILFFIIFSRISSSHKMILYSKSRIVMNIVFMFIVVYVLFPYAILAWDGRTPRGFQSITIYQGVFVMSAILIWWATFLMVTVVPVMFKVLANKYSNNN